MFLVVMLVSFLFLVGCASEQPAQTKGVFIGGTSGIIASFEPLSVKEENIYSIFDTEDFPLNIILKNSGEETLAPGKAVLHLLGPAQQDFENIPNWEIKNTQTIEKISQFNPSGGEEIVTFTSQNAKYKNKVTGYTDINWNLEYWYDYKTYLIINDVCFKGDITTKEVCNVKETRTFSVSGAPITITSVSEDSAGKGIIMLKIAVSNAGKGKATLIGKEFDNRFDQVAFVTDEPDKWDCKSGGRENEARLIDGKAEIICRLKNPLKEEDVYQRTVRLTFDYTYKDLVQEKLRIKESMK
jgi:hypothetical protein